jgi:hypothetical protein
MTRDTATVRQRWRLWRMLLACLCGIALTPPALARGADASPTLLSRAMPEAPGASGLAVVEAVVRNSPTFQFDGIEESLRLESVRGLTACPRCYEYTLYFESHFPGFGDRTGLVITPTRTPHRAKIVLVDQAVVTAVLDDAWDMTTQMILDFE